MRSVAVLAVLAIGLLDGELAVRASARSLMGEEGLLLRTASLGAALLLASIAWMLASGLLSLARRFWAPLLDPRAALVLFTLCALELSGWQGPPSPPPVAGQVAAAHPDVVLLTLDTFRADHLGAIGNPRRDIYTPALDALARQGALFTRGVAPVPLTLPAHAAMLTGRAPIALGLVRNGQRLGAGDQTVAGRFAAAGWRTGAFVSAAILRDRAGLDRGFQTYDDRFDAVDRLWDLDMLRPLLTHTSLRPSRRRGDVTVARALAWLQEPHGEQPSFLWVHLYDAHGPYESPKPYDAMYSWNQPDAQGNPAEMRAVQKEIHAEHELMEPFVPPDLRPEVARYAGAVSWTDAVAGELLDALPADAAVVVAADHGESLTEHGALLSHGSQVYETQTRVPILVRAPGRVPAGLRVDAPVSSVEVASTLLQLGDLDAPGPGLLDRLHGAGADEEILSFAGAQQSRDQVLLQQGWQLSLRVGDDKWVARRDGSVVLFHPSTDPGELNPGTAPAPERVVARVAALRAQLDAASKGEDSAQAQELRALGYQ